MPSRGSVFAVAVASTTLSPVRTTAAPWACLANFPVSNESCLPPARSTVTVLTSGFMFHPYCDQEGECPGNGAAMRDRSRCAIGILLRYCARCELAQCYTGFEEGGFLLDTLSGNVFARGSFHRKRSFVKSWVPHFSRPLREVGYDEASCSSNPLNFPVTCGCRAFQ